MELVFLAILILTMACALGAGFPVAFALPGSAILTIGLAALTGQIFAGDSAAYFAHGDAIQWLSAGVTNFRGVYWEVERDTLIAIPLFIFMGIMLQRSKLAEDLLVTMAQMFGRVPGGLGISVVFVGALLAATTGIVGATVVAMGLISLPAMLRNNYSHPIATGTIAASGTLGQIIPPSIVLIILADQLASAVDQASTARKELYKELTGDILMPTAFDVSSTSAGEMFLGAFVPGLVLVGLYMAFIMVVAIFRPSAVPTVRYEGIYDRAFFAKVFITLVPPLALIFLVLGSIITGVATVNQAGRNRGRGCPYHGWVSPLRRTPAPVLARHLGDGLPFGDRLFRHHLPCQHQESCDPRGRLRRNCFSDRRRSPYHRARVERSAGAADRGYAAHGDGRYGEDHFARLHHPAWRGDADRGIPRLRGRGTREELPDRPAGRVLGAVLHRDAGDLRSRFFPRLH